MASFMRLMGGGREAAAEQRLWRFVCVVADCFGWLGSALVAQVCCALSNEHAELRCTHHVPARASRACGRV